MDQANSSEEDRRQVVFICEDLETSKQIIREHMQPKKVTYTEMFDYDQRDQIIKALEGVQQERK